jgi:phage gp36-like protein
MFLLKEDFTTLVKDTNLNQIIENNDAIFDTVAGETIAQVRSYLFERYDTPTIFSKTGTERDAYLMKLCKHIAIYELYKRLPKYIENSQRELDYKEAITALEKIAAGEVGLDLPRKVIDSANNTNYTRRRFGSQPPRSH